ncbi:MAG: type III-B CRISPR-associated protein Cas10/Cmr2 [Candidatus Korarchaeota archaeon]|nr:type III-B CRISPR-associated protein Cas10/Cmr2 [Candidatus Korarchaeota archaeon]
MGEGGIDPGVAALKLIALLSDSPIGAVVEALLDRRASLEDSLRQLGFSEEESSRIKEIIGGAPGGSPIRDALGAFLILRFEDHLKGDRMADLIDNALSSGAFSRVREVFRALFTAPPEGFADAEEVSYVNPVDFSRMELVDEALRELLSGGKVRDLLDDYAKKLADAFKSAPNGLGFHAVVNSLERSLVEVVADRAGEESSAKILMVPPGPTQPYTRLLDFLYLTSAMVTALELSIEGKRGFSIVHAEVEGKLAYIASGRTPRDLSAASLLMSHLMIRAAMSVSEEWGPESILKPVLTGTEFLDSWIAKGEGADLVGDSGDLAPSLLPADIIMIAPGGRGEEAARRLLEKMKSMWRELVREVSWNCVTEWRKYVKDLLSNVEGDVDLLKSELKALRLISENDFAEPELPFHVSVVWRDFPEDLEERTEFIREAVRLGLAASSELERLSAVSKWAGDGQGSGAKWGKFADLGILISVMSRYRKAVSAYKVLTSPDILVSPATVDDRREFCTTCWSREAVVAAPSEEMMRGVPVESSGISKALEGLLSFSSQKLRLKPGERLCAHCLTRRLWHLRADKGRYPSTANIASYNFAATLLALHRARIVDISPHLRRVCEIVEGLREVLEKELPGSEHLVALGELSPADRRSGYAVRAGPLASLMEALGDQRVGGGCGQLSITEAFDNANWMYPETIRRVRDLLKELLKGEKRQRTLDKLSELEAEVRGLCQRVKAELSDAGGGSWVRLLTTAESVRKEVGETFTLVTGPSDSLALLKSDGDDAAELVSLAGRYEPDPLSLWLPSTIARVWSRRTETPPFLAAPGYSLTVGRALNAVARRVKDSLNRLGTLTIFAGGDDFFLMVPPEHAINAVEEIERGVRASWISCRDPHFGDYLLPGPGRSFTFSHSLRLIDSYDPLSFETREAFRGVEIAKSVESTKGSKAGLVISRSAAPAQRGEAVLQLSFSGVLEALVRLYREISLGEGKIGLFKEWRSFIRGLSPSQARLRLETAHRAGDAPELISGLLAHGLGHPELAPLASVTLKVQDGSRNLLREVLRAALTRRGAVSDSGPVAWGV